MAKFKTQGILAAFGEVFESVADVVNGDIFGEDVTDGVQGKSGPVKSVKPEPVSGSDEGGNEPEPVKSGKPLSVKQKLAAAFTPAKPAAKAGEAAGVNEPAEGDGADDSKTA